MIQDRKVSSGLEQMNRANQPIFINLGEETAER
jgi:hypothetical protein